MKGNKEMAEKKKKFLLVVADFYPDLTDMLAIGAKRIIMQYKHDWDRVLVPGALEIPPTIKYAAAKFDAFVALGVVIRGETSHYDLVCNESARGLMDLGVRDGLAIGNGIVTAENEAQARERCDPEGEDKGGAAAGAAHLLEHSRRHYGFQKKT